MAKNNRAELTHLIHEWMVLYEKHTLQRKVLSDEAWYKLKLGGSFFFFDESLSIVLHMQHLD